MFLIIISVVLTVFLFLALGIHKSKERYADMYFKLCKKQIFAFLPLLLIFINFLAIVPANHVGILYSPVSGVREDTIPEGWNKKGLLDKVYKISTEVQTVQLESITGQTKDSQWVDIIIDIKYRVNPDTAFQVFKQYKNLENVTNSFIPPAVQRSIESVTTRFNVMDFLGEKRNEVYLGIEEELKVRLADSGISFVSINFIDSDAGPEIEKAIKDEATAKQDVKTAEQNRQKAEIEAQASVIQAEADKQAAEVEAQTLLIEAEAQASANRMLSQSITPELIQKMEMEARQKWGWITVQGGNPIVDTRNSN